MRHASTFALACLVFGSTTTALAQPAGGDPQPPPQPAPPPAPPPATPPAPPPAPVPASPPAGPPAPGPPAAAPPPAGYGQPPPQPGYAAYPPGYGQPSPGAVPALEIPYEDGDPIPPGYVLETRMKRGLVIAGATTLGSLWLVSMIGGAIAVDNDSGSEFWPLFVPVAGPFIALGTHDVGATSGLLFVVNGLGQSAGLAMLIAGLATENEYLRYRGAGLELAPTFHVGADGSSTFGLAGAF